MALEQIADKVLETDVLVIGGGIAGCPAAAKAAEHGLNVTLAEKAKTDRSGSAAEGIDHFSGFFPRGFTPKEWIEAVESYGIDRCFHGGVPYSDQDRIYRTYANGQWNVEELEKLGVTMRWDDGDYRFMEASTHWQGPMIRVHWQNVKPEMARGVRKRGVNVLERTMVIDLLTNNGAVVGATAIDTRTGEFMVIKAKAVVIATAACSRVYNPETPVPGKYKFRYHWCPASVSGDGWAMAYRAGAELANMEITERGYRFRDDLTLSFGNTGNEGLEAKRLAWDGEEGRREQPGKDPYYFSLEYLPDDFQKRIEVAYADERLLSFKIAEERGFNPRTHRYEMVDARPIQLHVPPGIWADYDFKASLKGLYAIGDCVAGSHNVASASTSGFLVGDSIHTFVNEAPEPVVDEAQVENLKKITMAPLSVKDGTPPTELECAIRYVIERYVGLEKAEGRTREGIRRLGSQRRMFLNKLKAKNPHELMRALEVRNIMDVAELHIQASMNRKETRGRYIRVDYPERDPAFDDMLTFQRLENGKPVLEMRKVVALNVNRNLKEER